VKTIPDGIVGYRIFKLHHKDSLGYLGSRAFGQRFEGREELTCPPYLASLFMYSVWQPGLNNAECKGRTNLTSGIDIDKIHYCQETPGQNCNCGLQAYFRLGQKMILTPNFFEDYVFAAVLGGGKVLLHADGFRSEKAAVIGLLRNPYRLSKETLKAHQEVADKYQVPLLDRRDDLIELASSKGISIKAPTDLDGLDFDNKERKEFKSNRLINSGATNEAYGLGYVSELVLLNNLAGEKLITRDLNPEKEQSQTINLINQASAEMDKELTGFHRLVFNLFFKQTLLTILLTFLLWLMALVLFGLGVEVAFSQFGVNIPVLGMLLLTTLTFPIFVVIVFEKAEDYLRKRALKPAIDRFAT
jgi:hypothetical protein